MNCHVFVMRPSANVMFCHGRTRRPPAFRALRVVSAVRAMPRTRACPAGPRRPVRRHGRLPFSSPRTPIPTGFIPAVVDRNRWRSHLHRRPGPRAGAHVVIPDPIRDPDPRHRRSRWRASSTAETAARTEAGPRIGAGAPSGVTVGGRSRSCVPPSRQSKGRDRGVPVSRAIARACARGRGRAYRGGAARAPDCARETPDAPRPSVPAGVFFAAPAGRFLQKSRKAAPEAASLYFHSTPYRQMSSPSGNIK